MNQNLPVVGYSLAGIAFLALTVLLLTRWRGRIHGTFLPLATFASAVWGGLLAFGSFSLHLSPFHVFLIEIGNDAAWLVFLSLLMRGSIGSDRTWLLRYGGVILAAAIVAAGLWMEYVGNGEHGGAQLLIRGSMLTTLYGLVGIEQIYRNARRSQQNVLKFLCLGLGGIFAYDLFLYSNAVVSGYIDSLLWNARGFVVMLCVPLIAIAARRSHAWPPGIFLSRQVVFYTTTLVGAGLYLTIVGFAGYYIQEFGQEWGTMAQIIFFCAAVLALLIFLLSDQTRAKIRVFISKHFFESKYDYRDEWLRLNHTLTSSEGGLPLKKRAIKSLAQVIDAPSGYIWLKSEDDSSYLLAAGWNVTAGDKQLARADPLSEFLRRTSWVIDVRELRDDPTQYQSLEVDDSHAALSGAAFIVPLMHEDDLLGFVSLTRPPTPVQLNFEDHDLLKTAGQQIASYLAQAAVTEQLAESRQFEAFNRLTAYIMHDLKNAIAQQSLVVENAQKHKRNPEFIDDAIETIKGSVARMRRVINQLQQGSITHQAERVDLGKLVLLATSQCDDRKPVPVAKLPDAQIMALADRDRLLMAICHAIRNAQDATADDGSVDVEVALQGETCTIAIVDTGIGMDERFVRERLFKPFDSTKGAQGMGIGAYQIRETLRAAGGDVEVHSIPDQGTTFCLKLPLQN